MVFLVISEPAGSQSRGETGPLGIPACQSTMIRSQGYANEAKADGQTDLLPSAPDSSKIAGCAFREPHEL